jgi:hypothetical protein
MTANPPDHLRFPQKKNEVKRSKRSRSSDRHLYNFLAQAGVEVNGYDKAIAQFTTKSHFDVNKYDWSSIRKDCRVAATWVLTSIVSLYVGVVLNIFVRGGSK